MNLFSFLPWLPLAAAFSVGGLAGGFFMDALSGVQIADLQATHAAAQTVAAHADLARWQAASARADAAETRLQHAETLRQQTLKEKKHELPPLTTGRLCLAGPALRLLNGDSAPGLRLDRLPETAGQPAAPDGSFATDTDVGTWILDASEQYEHCRSSRQALIEWWPHD
jgi:hypothetical protein